MLNRIFKALATEISYGFAVAVFAVLGGQMAATLGLVFIVTAADFSMQGMGLLVAMIGGGVLAGAVIHYVLFGMFHRWRPWGELGRMIRLNRMVVEGRLRSDLTTPELQDALATLENLPYLNAWLAVFLSSVVVLVATAVISTALGFWSHGLYVLLGGMLAVALYVIFAFAVTELVIMDMLRQVRRDLARRMVWRGAAIHATLTIKLAFFVLLVAISLVVVGVPLRNSGGQIDRAVQLSMLSLAVGIFMSVLLFNSITEPLGELRLMAERLAQPGTEDAELFSGSSDREFTQVADHFYQAAQQIVGYRRQLQDLNQDLERKVEARLHELAEERNTLEVILNTMDDGLVLTDLEGRLLRVNPAFARITPGVADSLVGRRLVDVFPVPELMMLLQGALLNPGITSSADLVTRGQRIYRTSACVLRTADKMMGIVVVFRDITHDVEVDRMKTEFISTVSHELRTPLTSVLGFAKLCSKALERDLIPSAVKAEPRFQKALPRMQENLGIIVSEAERLTRLINDVLDVAKMEAGRIEWHDQSFDLAALVKHVTEEIRGSIEGKGVALVVDVAPELSMLWADSDRVQQVLLNLLSNAVKFTPRGEIKVTVKSLAAGEEIHEWTTPEDGGVLVEVADSGMGIPPEALSKLFKRFQQVGDTLRDKPKGTGLGLAICREIVLHYRGEIWCESELGKGSTFSFTLPWGKREAESRGPLFLSQIRRRVTDSLPAYSGDASRVLIVDDEEHIRMLLAEELSQAGYQILEASNGMDALTMARREQPDVILLDVMMPGLSGFDVTQLLKNDPLTVRIPILILSILEDRQRGLVLGADAYLTKPVEPRDLLGTVSGLVSGRREARRAMVAGSDRRILESITGVLRDQGFEVVEAYDPRGVLSTMEALRPDLVVLDEMLSQFNDAEILKALRFQDSKRSCTIVVVAGETPDHNGDGALKEPESKGS